MPLQIGQRAAFTGWFAQLQSSLPEGYFAESYEMSEEDNWYRVAITTPRSKSPLRLDLGVGVETPFGPTVEVRTPSGWRYSVGAEVFGQEGDTPDSPYPEFRTPMQAFGSYVESAFRTRGQYGGVRSAFYQSMLTGSGTTAGGVQMFGPNQTYGSQYDIASRVTIGHAQGAYMDSVLAAIGREMESPLAGSPWEKMRGYGLWRGDDQITRLRQYTVGSMWQSGPTADDVTGYLLSSGDPVKAVKQANISRYGGLRDAPFLYSGSQQLQPQGFGAPSGYKAMDLLMPGESTPRNVLLQQGVLKVPTTPFSGASMWYQDPFGGATARTHQEARVPLNIPSMGILPRAQIETGIFRQSSAGEWERVSGIVGHLLPAGETATIGLMRYPGEGGQQVTQPLTYTAGGGDVLFRSEPTLRVSKGYISSTGRPHAGIMGSGQPFPQGYVELRDPTSATYHGRYMEDLRTNFGGNVEASLMGQMPELAFPIGQEVGATFKGLFQKHAPMMVSQVVGQALSPTVGIGGNQYPVAGVVGGIKNIGEFTGVFGAAFSREQKAQFVQDVFGTRRGSAGAALAGYIQGLGPDQAVSMDEMARIYSRATRSEVPPEVLFERMGQAFHQMAWDRPDYSLQTYGAAYAKNQWINYGAVTGEGKQFLREEFMRALDLQNADAGTSMTAAERNRAYGQFMRFQRRGPDAYEWSMRQTALYGPAAMALAPEYLSSNPAWGLPETSSFSYMYPESARAAGMHVSQPLTATGFRPGHVRAWDTLRELYAYQRDPKGAMLPPKRTMLEPEQMQQMRSGLAGMERTDFDAMAEVIQSIAPGSGALVNPVTGAAVPRPWEMKAVSEMRGEGTPDEQIVDRMTRGYLGLVNEMLSGQSGKQTTRFWGEMEKIMGSSGGQIAKYQLARFMPGGAGGRFTGTSAVNVGEVLVSEKMMRQMLSGMAETRGVDRDTWTESAYQEAVDRGWALGMWARDPVNVMGGGVVAARFMTPEMIKQHRGIETSIPGGFSAAIGMGAMQTQLDWDADMMKMALVGKVTGGGLNIGPFSEMVTATSGPFASKREQLDYFMQAGFGMKGGVPGGEFDIWAKTLGEIREDPTSQKLRKAGIVQASPEEIWSAGLAYTRSKHGMGKAYNVRRWMESSATALGWGEKGVAALNMAGARSYQGYLDFLRSGFSNVEELMATATMGLDREGNTLRITGRTASGGFRELENSVFSTGLAGGHMVTAFKNALLKKNAMNEYDVTPEFGIGMMATSPEMMLEMQGRYQGGEDLESVLNAMIQSEGYDFTQTPGGLSLFANVIGRLTGQTRRGGIPHQSKRPEGGMASTLSLIKRAAGSKFFFGGQRRTANELIANEQIQNAIAGFSLMSGYSGPIAATEMGTLAALYKEGGAPLAGAAVGLGGLTAEMETVMREVAAGSAIPGQALTGMTATEREEVYTGWRKRFSPEVAATMIENAEKQAGEPLSEEQAAAERAKWRDSKRAEGAGGAGGIPPTTPPAAPAAPAGGGGRRGGGRRGGSGESTYVEKLVFLGRKTQAELQRDVESGALAMEQRWGEMRAFETTVGKYLSEEEGITGETVYDMMQQVISKPGPAANKFLQRFGRMAAGFAPALRQIRAAGRAMESLGDVGVGQVVGEDMALLLGGAAAPETGIGQTVRLPELIRESAKAAGVQGAKTPLEGAIDKVTEAFNRLEKTTVELDKAQVEHGRYSKEFNELLKRASIEDIQARRAVAESGYASVSQEMEGMPEGSPEFARARLQQLGYARQISTAQRAEMAAEAQPAGGDVSQAIHGLLGGWNIMYMQRLVGLGMGSFQQGYAERERFQTAAEAQAIRTLGVGQVNVRENAEMQYQQALLRSGGGTYRQFRQLQAGIVGGGFGDIQGAAMTGIGIMGLAAFAGPKLEAIAGTIGSQALGDFGAGVGLYAGRIGVGAAVGSFLYSQYSNIVNREDTQERAAAMMAGGNLPGAVIQSLGPTIYSWFTGDRYAEETGALARQVESYQQGAIPTAGGRRMSQAEIQRFSRILAQTPGIDQIQNLSPELIMQLAPGLTGAGYGINTLGQMGTAIQAGLPILETTAALNQLRGGGAMTQNATVVAAAQAGYAGMTEADLLRYSMGAQFGAGISGMTQYLQAYGTGDWSSQINQLGGIAGGVNQQRFLQQFGMQSAFQNLGLNMPTGYAWSEFDRDRKWSESQLWGFNQYLARGQQAASMGQSMAGIGVERGYANNMLGFAMGGANQMAFMQGMMNLSPVRITQAAQAGAGGIFDQLANVDINLAGQMTGLGWGTTSLQRGGIGAEAMATQIWGDRWRGVSGETWNPPDWAQAAVYGIQTPSGATVAGMRGLQWLQFYNQQEAAGSRLGIQAAQLALQEQYQPLFWGVEDRQRALANQQAQWGFQYQRQQFTLQGQQFGENMAFQQMQQLQQRSWTQQDWAYQDQVRGMQWGWQQEDFEENVRFMSGRQRRLAERQMERQTIMHGMEGDRIETLRDRQKDMWRMEDDRHEMTVRHFEEQRKLQEENMEKQEEFYKQNKKLQDEMIELRREYWRKQMDLQKQSLAISEQELKRNKEIQAAIMELSQTQEDYNGLQRIASETQTETLNALIKGLNHIIENAPEALMSILEQQQIFIPPLEGGGAGTGGSSGGSTSPLDDYRTTLPDQTFSGPGGGATSVTVYIGNERLGEFVTDAVTREVRIT